MSAVAQQSNKNEIIMARDRAIIHDRWSHKNEGTPETHEHASKVSLGSLSRLYMSGRITIDQLAWAVEIATVAEYIERDVAIRIVSYEPRIDNQASSRDVLVESIIRVRQEVAYGYWRKRIPEPKRAVLDMLIGHVKSLTAVASAYSISRRRVRRLLISAIDLWPDAMDFAQDQIDVGELAAAHAGLS